jgi:hypothetical protein
MTEEEIDDIADDLDLGTRCFVRKKTKKLSPSIHFKKGKARSRKQFNTISHSLLRLPCSWEILFLLDILLLNIEY